MIRAVAITDRRRFPDIVPRVAEIVRAVPRGAVAIQIREKDLDGGALLALARDVIAVARPAGAPVWINDRVDVALAAGADGVHLPERGMAIADARALAAGRLAIGGSRHSAEAARATGADWVQLGPIFETPGKGPPLGIAALADSGAIAVGGIDSAERAEACARAGAEAVAVIRAAWTSDLATLVAAVERGCRDRVRMTP